MSDDELRSAVAEELNWDPKVDSSTVAVSARAGVVTLRGRVGSFAERCAAMEDVRRLHGVVGVEDRLKVELLDEYRRDDAELYDAVLQALRLNALVPSTIDATVRGGWVTLTGTASSQFQRDEAEFVTVRVRGVRGLADGVRLVPLGTNGGEVVEVITRALRRSARLEASAITVESSNGTVTLRGTVGSWADHDEAVAAAWNAPGVVQVVDDLHVTD